MTATEPNGWELKRSIDQLREDVGKRIDDSRAEAKEDGVEVKAALASLSVKLDGQPTRAELASVVTRVDKLEERAEKRSERSVTIWLGIGIAVVTSAVGSITAVMIAVAQR